MSIENHAFALARERSLLIALLWCVSPSVAGAPAEPPANLRQIQYEADDSIFPNPERGFFKAYNPAGRDDYKRGILREPHAPLNRAELKALRDLPEAITLVRDVIRIGKFWGSDISAQRVEEIEADWAAAREAGLKVIPRFVYSWGIENSDPEEGAVMRHIEQLGAVLARNTDVIAWVQGGFLGGCGEGNASEHYIYSGWDNGSRRWQKLNEAGRRLYARLLEAVPRERSITLRYPRYKWDMLGWTPPTARALTVEKAFDGAPQARLGYYDDGFMGDARHYAMFQMPGEDDFAAADSAFTVFEGEISDASPYKLQPRQVVIDMERYHQTALNVDGDRWARVSAAWKQNGDYETICRRMGYRLRLLNARIAAQATRAGSLMLRIEMTNDGFGPVYNPRGVEVILRHRASGALYSVGADHDRGNRLWLPGPGETKTLDLTARLARSMPTGDYEVLLHLPDSAPRLHDRPEYSIRLANKGVWEPTTGFNRLLATVRVTSGPGAAAHPRERQYVPRRATEFGGSK